MAEKLRAENAKLFEKARRCLVGGVDSPVRSFAYAGTAPLLIKEGRGSRVYDYGGNEYIDYVLSWGSAILGHANRPVVRAVKRAMDRGFGFGATNDIEIKLAEEIRSAVPFIEKIRFVNSGTEAVMGAIRLARGYTGREKIIKFQNSYHGHADYLLAKSGSGLATLNIPSSRGVPKDFLKHTIIAPYGDSETLEKLFKKHGRRIAAVIVEPVGANYGVILPDIDFLKKARKVSVRYGSLLIFDEIVTGFRFGFGSFAQEALIDPDIITLGKIIGGGLPVGAYGGTANIMDRLAPSGKVYQASTFAGNPIVMQAGLSTLNILKRRKVEYLRLERLAGYLCAAIGSEAYLRGIDLRITRYGNIFSLKFADKAKFRRFYREMLGGGIFLAPSEFEANFLSFAHARADIEETVFAAKKAFIKIGAK